MSAQDRIGPPATAPGEGFRADINGLRAISVLAVVAYHFDRTMVPGGYLGVDVFFVISGYLMTNIIVGRMRRGSFNLWSFYGDRARRIVPALAVMCAVATIVGAVALDPWTYQRLAADVPAVLLFVSNIVFASRSGYFAPAAETEWMLHTWSLSVEWQFYLTYPILILLFSRIAAARRHLGWLLIAGLVGSFAAGPLASHKQAAWVFYMEPTRSWELFAGGLCAWYAAAGLGAWTRWGLHIAGLALIGASLFLLGDNQSWPSAWTAVPVLGAALVVLAGVKDALWARWRLVGLIGRSSYSTYIWHWPLIVALRYEGVRFTPAVIAGGTVLCLLVGLASYWLIERRLTAGLAALPGALRRGLGTAGLVAVVGFATGAAATHGFEAARTAARPPAVLQALRDDRAARDDWIFDAECGHAREAGGLSACRLGDPAARQVLVIGDSHAQMVAARYVHPAGAAGVTFLTRGGCAPVPGVGLGASGADCVRWTARAYRYAEQSPYRRIVIMAAWPAYFPQALGDTPICFADASGCHPPRTLAGYRSQTGAAFDRLAAALGRLAALGRQVVVIGPIPTSGEADPMQLYRRTFWTGETSAPPFARSAFERYSAPVRAALIAASRAAGATYVEPLDGLCPDGQCPVVLGGRALYKDNRHFRAWGMSAPAFQILDPWLEPTANDPAPPSSP